MSLANPLLADIVAYGATPSHAPLAEHEPRTLAEIAGHADAKAELLALLQAAPRPIACVGPPGIGIATCVRLAARVAGLHVCEHSAARGATKLAADLEHATSRVLHGLLGDRVRYVQLVRDVEVLNRTERASLFRQLDGRRAVLITADRWLATDRALNAAIVDFRRPDLSATCEHLAWVAALQQPSMDAQALESIARSATDVRQAVRHIVDGASASAFEARDALSERVEPYAHALRAFETLPCARLVEAAELVDALSLVDVTTESFAIRSSREMFVDVAQRHALSSCASIASTQTTLARHAQVCNRVAQLTRACRALGVHHLDMDLVGKLWKRALLRDELGPWPITDPDAKEKNQSMFTIVKRKCNAADAKQVKLRLV